MTIPAIITVAITGAVPSKADNPAVPISPAEQIASTEAAFRAGASLVHVHVRDDAGRSSSDPARFAEVQAGIRDRCPGMIIQFSTGGRGRAQNERARPLDLKPDMASLATGSVNFAAQIYENHPDLVAAMAATMRDLAIKPEIEVFDLAMLYATQSLIDRGLVVPPPHVQFVLGIPNALPARRRLLEFAVAELADLMSGATWTAAGIGRHQLEVARWALELGGHVRTGLEDNLKYDRSRLAASNAELVEQVAAVCPDYNRHPATPGEARAILGLPPAS
ncbi:MAG: 3-keto-5-aminohexanoate cleavage protein [Rhodospirillales bacterium]|nr:MAG: 3-keto-5-aminohexanoate cleavage protein [Rhodospirillales bacterium]